MRLKHIPGHAWTAEFAKNVVKVQLSGMIFYGVIIEQWINSRENKGSCYSFGPRRYIVQIMNSRLLLQKNQFTYLKPGEELPNVYAIQDEHAERHSSWLLNSTLRDLAKLSLVLDGSHDVSRYRASSAATPEGTRRLRFEMR